MEPIELRSPWPATTVLSTPPPVRFGCPLHAGELLPCRRRAAWGRPPAAWSSWSPRAASPSR